jgi:predicted DNA-binding transcriptional regulator YafY
VAEIRWHRTQEVSWNDDGSITFTATVEGLTEIRWWLLGYGDQVIVESPPELRTQMAEIATRMLESHRVAS